MCQTVPSAHHPASSDLSAPRPRKWCHCALADGNLKHREGKRLGPGHTAAVWDGTRTTSKPLDHLALYALLESSFSHKALPHFPGVLIAYSLELETGDYCVCISAPLQHLPQARSLRGAHSLKGNSLCIDTRWRKFMWRRMHHKTSGPDSKFSGSSKKTRGAAAHGFR